MLGLPRVCRLRAGLAMHMHGNSPRDLRTGWLRHGSGQSDMPRRERRLRGGVICRRSPRPAVGAFCFTLLIAGGARAERWVAPVGGRPLPLGAGRVVCREPALQSGWRVEPDAHSLRPPTKDEGTGQLVTVTLAPTEAGCAASTSTMLVVATGARPAVDALSIDLDAGRAVARGRGLRGAVLHWISGARTGFDVCVTPVIMPPTAETCAFAIPRDFRRIRQAGSSWGFVFGPSISIDYVGTNF